MVAASITRMNPMQLFGGTVVGAGIALAIGVPTLVGAIGGLAIAGVASELSRRCLGGGRRFTTTGSSNVEKINANVVHLGQSHWGKPAASDPRIAQKVWNSQKSIAKYLLLHPNAEVFVEGVHNRVNEENRQRNRTNTSLAFPDGLPQNLELLNDFQKKIFMQLGAPLVLYYLGKIKTPHGVISPEKEQENVEAVQREFKRGNCDPDSKELHFLTVQRDEALIEEIKTFLRTDTAGDEDRQIIIVFGAGHNLAEYFDAKKFTAIKCE